jgi:hypothetical protein
VGNNTWDNSLDPHAVARGASTGPSATILDMTPPPNPVSYANELKLGSKVIIEAIGEWTSAASVTTLLISLWFGTTATVIAASSAVTPTASQTSMPWHVRWNGKITAVGTSGVIYGHGILDIVTASPSSAYTAGIAMPQSAAARSVTIDTTAMKQWGIGGTWAAATAGNTARCDVFNVQILNQGKT